MSSAARLLREHFPEIVEHVGRARAKWAPVVVDYLQRSLAAARGRGAGGIRASRARSAAMREGIRKAIAALPAGLAPRDVVGICRRRLTRNLEAYGLERVPCDAVIRAEVRNRNLSSQIAHAPPTTPYSDCIETAKESTSASDRREEG